MTQARRIASLKDASVPDTICRVSQNAEDRSVDQDDSWKSEDTPDSPDVSRSTEAPVSGLPPWLWARRTFYSTETRRVGSWTVVAGAIISVVLILVFSSGGGSKPSAVVTGGETASSSPPPDSAVEEIGKRDIWSSAPLEYAEANSATKREPYSGGPISIPTENNGELKSKPEAASPNELAERSSDYLNGLVLLIGKVRSVQTYPSLYMGQSTEELREGAPHRPQPVTQAELAGSNNLNAYVEFNPAASEISLGEVIVALGRVAAIGETKRDTVKSAYMLAELAEPIREPSELDSSRLRELYAQATKMHG